MRNIVIGVRRETKNRWECRAPLTPTHIRDLMAANKSKKIEFVVQPCARRVFASDEYADAGATISDDLSRCDLILGVKEVPVEDLIPGKQFFFFSHTHKGQLYNMGLLKAVCDKKITLLDYELLTDDAGRRLVAFGAFAGYAGMINCLHGLGDRLLTLGYRTPFLAKAVLEDVGNTIRAIGIPRHISPLIFVFTGTGNVSRGAQEMFKLLPHEFVAVEQLPEVVSRPELYKHKLVGCVASALEYSAHKDKEAFSMEDYYRHPEMFGSVFHETIAPYSSVIVNGIYWDPRFPRLLTDRQAVLCRRLLSVCDISCDINGSIEFTKYATSIDDPFYYYDPETSRISANCRTNAKGIQMMTIDNLPTQLPRDASEHFSDALLPIIGSYIDGGVESVAALKRAAIAIEGRIVPRFAAQLCPLISSLSSKKILVLGAGLVSRPVIEYLLQFPEYSLTVLAPSFEEIHKIGGGERLGNVLLVQHEIKEGKIGGRAEKAIKECDLVISLLPATLHPVILETVLENKKHLITASYNSPRMEELAEEVRACGLTWLNEIGLDPGLDHMSAMKIIDETKARGCRIESFVSWCGGLPAPEHADNPIGYKFSWSPRGALLATQNSATYLERGNLISVGGKQLLSVARPITLHPAFAFEGLPNRDSIKYIDLYGLSHKDTHTMFRGTLRYTGFSEFMEGLNGLGFLDQTASNQYGSWLEAIKDALQTSHLDRVDWTAAVLSKLPLWTADKAARFVHGLHTLGMLCPNTPYTLMPTKLDALCELLREKLKYGRGERDMIFLQHQFVLSAGAATDSPKELVSSTLCMFGDGESMMAMSLTVGLPVAIAARLVLEGVIGERGVLLPTKPAIYLPMLAELDRLGIKFVEKRVNMA